MTDRIEPALTADEWAKIEGDAQAGASGSPLQQAMFGYYSDRHGYADYIAANDLPSLIALANAALPDDDPRKITRETIAGLDWVLQEAGFTGDYTHTVEDKLRPIRDALAAYLPPE